MYNIYQWHWIAVMGFTTDNPNPKYKDTIFISFNAAVPKHQYTDPSTIKPFSHTWFEKQGIAHICVATGYNDWYLNGESESMVIRINEYLKQHAHKQVITYWWSMWWYAALRYANDLNATDVLVFNPQIDLNLRPWTRVHCPDIEVRDIPTTINANIHSYRWKDPDDQKQMLHAMQTKTRPKAKFTVVPTDSHRLMEYLKETEQLHNINLSIVKSNVLT